LRVILKLRELIDEKNAGVTINEIPLFICWKDDDYLSLAKKIVEIRERALAYA
jgi:hypothetical protein